MEKRKWLWKRKSSERSPGETESSGSISSHSERYSDDQPDAFKTSPCHNIQSPEVTSKTVGIGEDADDSIRSLTEKLSAALVNVSAKDDLVKQHAKVAEEAVAGWEMAENEVSALKQKLEAAGQQNSALEDRISHLDGALKECVRQLRQAREEQEQKIHEAVMKKTSEWESTKCELESQLLELQSKADAVTSKPPLQPEPDLCQKLESLERENSDLKIELLSQSEELEIRTIERDLSTQAAEMASKQHLESIKKVAKLEAECRRLKALACKSSSVNDHRSVTASSIYVESLTDSQSDSGERLNAVDIETRKMSGLDENKCESGCSDSWASALIAELDQFTKEKSVNKNLPTSSIEIDLMDDFLEMERLAALPETEHEKRHHESESAVKNSSDTESSLRAELEAMIQRTAELEENLKKIEVEKAELETEFAAKQSNDAESLLRSKLETMMHRTEELEEKVEKMEVEKAELQFSVQQSDEVESLLKSKLETMMHRTVELEEKVEKMETAKAELEFSIKQSHDAESLLKCELEIMMCRAAELEENAEQMEAEKAELQMALKKSQDNFEASLGQLREVERQLEELQKELSAANESKQSFESQLLSMEVEARAMSVKVDSLEADIKKERAFSEQIKIKCQELEEELTRRKKEVELQQIARSNDEAKIKQEDLAVAAGKLAECQKTIASLGKQLQSLATLEDFLIDTANIPGFCGGGSLIHSTSGEPWKLSSNETFSARNSDSPKVACESSGPSISKNNGNSPPSASSSTSPAVLSSNVSAEKNRNGFAKFFTRSKNGIQLEI